VSLGILVRLEPKGHKVQLVILDQSARPATRACKVFRARAVLKEQVAGLDRLARKVIPGPVVRPVPRERGASLGRKASRATQE
jgi:hypothetical protein